MERPAKTIWYCHHYAGSPSMGMSYRPYYLTKEFSRAGHKAYVISASFHHLLQQSKRQQKAVQLQEIDGVSFITLRVTSYLGNGLQRFANMLGYAWGFRRHVNKIVSATGAPDVIIVSSSHPFHFSVLNKVAKRFSATLIFEVRDLWPLSLVDLLKLPTWHPLIVWLAKIERRAYRHSDAVVSLLKDAFPYMSSKGLRKNQFHVIPNGTSSELFDNAAPLSTGTEKKLKNLVRSGSFLLGYAGAVGQPNALHYLIQAMAILKNQNPRIHCIILGEGHLKEALAKEVIRLALDNVSFFSSIPKFEIPAFLKELDGFYLGWHDSTLYQHGVSPNKLFDYMMAGKPIIESGGATPALIEEVGCGIRCAAAHPQEIAQAIARLYTMPREQRAAMGKRGMSAVKTTYDYRVLAQHYLKLF